VFMDAMAACGVTTPATQHVAWITSRRHRRGEPDPLQAEDLVAFDAGVVASGYVGELARTWPVGEGAGDRARPLYRRAQDLWDGLLAACRPGAPCSDLLAAYEAVGEALPPTPIATGLGLGFDVPVVTRDLPMTAAAEQLEPGMVLAVTAQVADGTARVLRKDAVLITPDGPEVLTSSPHWQP
jgi:Xaa-Pro dipeptidase